MNAIDRLVQALENANVEPTPRTVARQFGATIFHLSAGGNIHVRGQVEGTWPPAYWQPMTEAAQAGDYHPIVRKDGTKVLVLEVS